MVGFAVPCQEEQVEGACRTVCGSAGCGAGKTPGLRGSCWAFKPRGNMNLIQSSNIVGGSGD